MHALQSTIGVCRSKGLDENPAISERYNNERHLVSDNAGAGPTHDRALLREARRPRP